MGSRYSYRVQLLSQVSMTELLLSLALMDQVYLARCIQGEGAALFPNQDEVGMWIGSVIENRVLSPWFPNDIPSVVRQGCHGYTNAMIPDDWAMSLALRVLSEPDASQGSYFFLSGDDLRNNGWSKDTSVKDFYEGRWSLHFFRKWVE